MAVVKVSYAPRQAIMEEHLTSARVETSEMTSLRATSVPADLDGECRSAPSRIERLPEPPPPHIKKPNDGVIPVKAWLAPPPPSAPRPENYISATVTSKAASSVLHVAASSADAVETKSPRDPPIRPFEGDRNFLLLFTILYSLVLIHFTTISIHFTTFSKTNTQKSANNHLDVPFRTVCRGSQAGQFSEGSEKVREG